MTDDMHREAFERVIGFATYARDSRFPKYYGNPVVQGAWECWCAAIRHMREQPVSDEEAKAALEAFVMTERAVRRGQLDELELMKAAIEASRKPRYMREQDLANRNAAEPLCVKCGNPTMHIGNICYACIHSEQEDKA